MSDQDSGIPPVVEDSAEESPAIEPTTALPSNAAEPPAPAAAASPVATAAPAPGAQPSPAPSRDWLFGMLAAAVAISLVIGTAGGFVGGYFAYRQMPSDGTSSTSGNSASTPSQIEVIGNTTEDAASAAAAVALPSVVSIAVSGTIAGGGPSGPDSQVEGEGSGVAYQPTGDGGTYIITNYHVIEGADTLTVTDYNGDSYDATVVGGDADSDLAVVLVDAEIPTIEIGDSENLVVGQFVVAIGSPFGLEQTVTSGIVSALHRMITESETTGQYPYVDAIQTDAAINPGNSGGALVDSTGALVGIPSAIYSDSGASAGVGIAIPAHRATQAADDIISKGSVDTPYLGILGQDVDEALANDEGLPVTEGAYVVEVTAGTNAELAGLQAGDVIVSIDGSKIQSMDELILTVRQHSVGDTITLELYRAGSRMTLEMTVGAKPQTTSTTTQE